MELADTINLALKVLTLAGLTAALLFVSMQLLIRKLEKRVHHSRTR